MIPSNTPYRLIIALLLISTLSIQAQQLDSLRLRIQQFLSAKKAVAGIYISDNQGKDTLSINGQRHFPMQSVFKFHIGLVMLSEIDKGRFSLDQKITLKKSDLLPDLYSPIREKYPEGVTLSMAEILKYAISQSDNAACDALLRLLGGPQIIEAYFASLQFTDIAIKINEEVMQHNWDLQFQNWTTPAAANQVLQAFYNNTKQLLSKKSHAFLWKIMKETTTGQGRIKGQLPKGTEVAHKTGWSGAHGTTGITAAVNDIGIVFLPNGQHFFISMFVTDCKEDLATAETLIAGVAKMAWDYFLFKTK